MSDYTPTTEHVQAVYGRRSDTGGIPYQDTERLAEFDRWLAAHTAEKRAEWEAEPTDAEVMAASLALDGQIAFELVRAALRAAYETKGEGR